MHFSVEIDHLHGLKMMDPGDSTVCEAMESVYPTGSAVCIHMAPRTWAMLPLAGGLSDIYNDIIKMLKGLDIGVYPFEISFLCSSFTTIWEFVESNGVLAIRTTWTTVNGTSGGLEIRDAHFNAAVSELIVERHDFVAEWRKVLTKIKHDLLFAGYGHTLDNFEYLEQLD